MRVQVKGSREARGAHAVAFARHYKCGEKGEGADRNFLAEAPFNPAPFPAHSFELEYVKTQIRTFNVTISDPLF